MMTNTDRLRIAAYSSLKKNLANVMCYVRKGRDSAAVKFHAFH